MRNFKGLIVLGRHLICAACLLCVLAATTNAYSIVMRGGKRVEIPAQFSVTNMTLTYESAPGFWITLQMAAIDIPATERANNELPGSLLGRITKEAEPLPTSDVTSQARESKALRSVTNRELESFQRLRVESERAYERRLRAQGLPPLAVLRAQAAADDDRAWQELEQKRAEDEANDRASQLQAQIAALSAQLDYLQSRSYELSSVSSDPLGYDDNPFSGGGYAVDPTLSQTPFGLPNGGAYGTYDVPYGSPSRFPGLRRNTIGAPGTRFPGLRRNTIGAPGTRFTGLGRNVVAAPGTRFGGRAGFRGGPRWRSGSR